MLFVNIESVPAIDQLEQLLTIPGVDGVFIGPHDLSVSMNCPEEWDNPEYQKMLSHIIKVARLVIFNRNCS